jgi:hypothetical protein
MPPTPPPPPRNISAGSRANETAFPHHGNTTPTFARSFYYVFHSKQIPFYIRRFAANFLFFLAAPFR